MWQGSSLTNTILITPQTISGPIHVSASNACGSSSIAILEVTVMTSPVLSVSASNDKPCAGQSVTITAGGANSYTWMPVNVTGNQFVLTPSSGSVLTVAGSGPGGCVSTQNYTLAVGKCLGLGEKQTESPFILYPNPFLNTLSVKNDIHVREVRIYSAIGQQMRVFDAGFGEMDLSPLSAGMYIVVISGETAFYTTRIIKQ
jgi:hypothetical protein